MNIKITPELIVIFRDIEEKKMNSSEWSKIESSDMYQTINYCGGFDATEQAFCFSYYDEKNEEYWFQVSIIELQNILKNKIKYIEVKKAA